MLYTNFSVYQTGLADGVFAGSICENNFFSVLTTHDGLTEERGNEVLKKLASEIAEQKLEHLSDFDSFITDFCKKENLPAVFSLSCGFLSGDVFFLKTVGDGMVFVQRRREFQKLIHATTSASGYVEDMDVFVFTTQSLVSDADDEKRIQSAITKGDPAQAVEQLKALEKDKKGVALILSFEEKQATLSETERELVTDPVVSAIAEAAGGEKKPNKIIAFIDSAKRQLQGQEPKKKKTMVIVGIVLVVFVWSVVLGYQRRANAQSDKMIKETRETITEKLTQADDVAFLNLGRATALITDARRDVEKLKKSLNGSRGSELAELEVLVAAKEGKILKKEDRGFDEYFDLSVENKNATGSRIYLDGDTAVVLDSQNGAAYLLSLTKKSLDSRTARELKNGSLISKSQDAVLVYKKGEGVTAIDADGKAKKVLENDSDWREIVSMISYNGNLYLLDSGRGDVFKYVPAEKGFSDKSSYFKGQDNPDIGGSVSLAIDLSVYVGFSKSIAKFTSGVRDGFSPTFPESSISMVKILTSKDIEKMYAWDKSKSAVYVVNKEGTYERQIKSTIFSQAADLVVYGTNAYVLKGSKIYKVDLN